MKKSIIAASIGLAVLSTVMASPSVAREKEVTTPSGRAEMVFGYTALPDALTTIQSKCMDKGWMVSSQTSNQVVCEVPMGIWQSAFTQMMIGNSYSTEPKQFARFSLAQVGEHVRIQTQVWAETQMAFGQMQQHQYTDDATYNNMLGFMGEAGAQLPVGSRFTASAYLGIDGVDGTVQNGRRSAYAYQLTRINEAAPGYRWGLRSGDLITKINNRTFRDDEGMVALLNRQRVGENMSVTFVRDGAEQTLSGTAEGRPTINALVRQSDVPPGATAIALQMGVALYGDVPKALAAMNPDAAAEPVVVAAEPMVSNEAVPVESDLDRMRREAAEAQARLAAAEAAAAQPVTTPQ